MPDLFSLLVHFPEKVFLTCSIPLFFSIDFPEILKLQVASDSEIQESNFSCILTTSLGCESLAMEWKIQICNIFQRKYLRSANIHSIAQIKQTANLQIFVCLN